MSSQLANEKSDPNVDQKAKEVSEEGTNRFVCLEPINQLMNNWSIVGGKQKFKSFDNKDPELFLSNRDSDCLDSRFARKVTIQRPLSPILGDPELTDRPSDDPLNDKEVECMRVLDLSVVGVMLNEGTFATIYECTHKSTGRELAIKRSLNLRQSWAELEALTQFGSGSLSHKNIIDFYGHQVIGCRMYLMLELSQLGDLAYYLFSEYRDKDLTESLMFDIFSQVCNGVQHMHTNGYVHRDLKLQNILVFDGQRENSLCYKLCDFGSARGDIRLSDGAVQLSTTIIGDIRVMAPEEPVLPYDPMASDTYSLGVMLYQLAHSGDYPFNLDQQKVKQTKANINELTLSKLNGYLKVSVTYLPSLSKQLQHLLNRLLNPFPNYRITLPEVSAHHWFVKHLAQK